MLDYKASSPVAPIPTEAPHRDGLSRPRGQTFLDQPPSGDLEVTVDFLTEVDKLVQLIECPIFTCKSPASAAASAPLPGWGVGRALPQGCFQNSKNGRLGMTGPRSPVQQDRNGWYEGERPKVGLVDPGQWVAKPTRRLITSLPGAGGPERHCRGAGGAAGPELFPATPASTLRSAQALRSCGAPWAHLQGLLCAGGHTLLSLQSRVGACRERLGRSCLI